MCMIVTYSRESKAGEAAKRALPGGPVQLPRGCIGIRAPVGMLGWAWGQGTSEARCCPMWQVPLTSLCDRQAGLAWLLARGLGGNPKEKLETLPLGSAPATRQSDSCPVCFENVTRGFRAWPGLGLDAGNPRLAYRGCRWVSLS